MKYKPQITPWKHQKLGLKRLWKQGSGLVWWDTGTGKTKLAIDYAFALHIAGRLDNMVVVCPVSALGVWEAELRANLPTHYGFSVTTYSQNRWDTQAELLPSLREAVSAPGVRAILVTYSTLSRYADKLAKLPPHLLVFDEAHRITNYSAAQTRRALYLSRHARYILPMSGTPCPNGYEQLYYPVKMCDALALPPTFKEFKARYCVMGGYMGKEITDYVDVKGLGRRIAPVVLRATKSILNLPPVVESRVSVAFEKKTRRLYDTLKDDLVAEVRDGVDVTAPSVAVLLIRLAQIAGGYIHNEAVGKEEKMRALVETLESETGKVVVWFRFKKEIKAALEKLQKHHSCAVIDGSVSGRKRTRIIRRFQKRKDPQVLLGQIGAMGEAVTLTQSSTAIYYSLNYSSLQYNQSRGRLHRGGQKNVVHYVHLMVEDSIDEVIYDVLKRKMDRESTMAEIVRRLTGAR